MTRWTDYVDKIIYINLDRRTDRRSEFEFQMSRLNIPKNKILRFKAIEHSKSIVGCNLSHAAVLKLAHTLNYKNVLIFEDDFNFIDDTLKVENSLTEFFELIHNGLEWDACHLVFCPVQTQPYNSLISKCLKSTNAAGYIVNHHMFKKLSTDIIDASVFLEKTGQHWNYSNDVVWWKYMTEGKWFVFNETLGYQRISYSDLSSTISDCSGGLDKSGSTKTHKYYSQMGQDKWVHSVLGDKKDGYFVEVGASDGIALSNTYFFEKHLGWNGICIEANDEFYQNLEKNRHCYLSHDLIFHSDNEEVDFCISGLMSGILNKNLNPSTDKNVITKKKTSTLSSVLDKFNAPEIIDYFSLDVEGQEFFILSSFPFDKYKFRCITVAHNACHVGPINQNLIRSLLTLKGYIFVKGNDDKSIEDFYIHPSLVEHSEKSIAVKGNNDEPIVEHSEKSIAVKGNDEPIEDLYIQSSLVEHSEKSIITADIIGGLANQLYIVAMTHVLAWKYNLQPIFQRIEESPSVFKNRPVYWDNILSKVDVGTVSNKDLIPINENKDITDLNLYKLESDKSYVLKGYYQSPFFINEYRDKVLDLFRMNQELELTIKNMYDRIKGDNVETVSIHVRRGDYLQLSYFHPIQSIDYYKSASELFDSNILFVVFSDDISWCKENFNFLENKYFVEHSDQSINIPCEVLDLKLMGLCDHNIITNSAFSWWASWMNENLTKKVIAPRNWFCGEENEKVHRDPTWITL